jgi:hypothetical protein
MTPDFVEASASRLPCHFSLLYTLAAEKVAAWICHKLHRAARRVRKQEATFELYRAATQAA